MMTSQGPYRLMMQPSILTIMMTSQGPYRHYVLNLLWILINVLCLALTIYHLNKLYRCNIIGDFGDVNDGDGYHQEVKGKKNLLSVRWVFTIHPPFFRGHLFTSQVWLKGLKKRATLKILTQFN